MDLDPGRGEGVGMGGLIAWDAFSGSRVAERTKAPLF